MRTILAPTDFSETANNSVLYAAHNAQKTNAALILFHAYHTNPVTFEIPTKDITLDDIKKEALASLEKIKENLLTTFPALTIRCEARAGFAVDVINDYVLENDIDLLVLGMQGTSLLGELLVGSITTELSKNPPCPILIIGSEMQYIAPKKVLWACDNVKPISEDAILELRNFFDHYPETNIDVVNIVHPLADTKDLFSEKSLAKINSFVSNRKHSIKAIRNNDIVEGINTYVEKENIDLVVMQPRQHATWRSLFFERNTRRMAYHSKVPLLVIKP